MTQLFQSLILNIREIKHMSVQRLDQDIYRSFIFNNQKLETTQVRILATIYESEKIFLNESWQNSIPYLILLI